MYAKKKGPSKVKQEEAAEAKRQEEEAKAQQESEAARLQQEQEVIPSPAQLQRQRV